MYAFSASSIALYKSFLTLTGVIKYDRAQNPNTDYSKYGVIENSQKIQFSKRIVRCIIKAVEEGDIFEYSRADTSTGLGTLEITPIYGR